MRTIRILTAVLCTHVLFASSFGAEEQKASDRKAQRQQQLLRQFDKDGNGKLDEQEKKALQEYLKSRKGKQSSQPSTSMPALLEIPPGVKQIANIEYARIKDEPLLLDIYLPEKVRRPMPVIVWIHGGAWAAGSKDPCQIVSFSGKGYAIVSMNYRLTGVAQFPAQINDCKAVVRWVRAHAAEYGFDPDHVGVAGGSAGGHLVALLGTSGDAKELEGDVGGNLKYSSRVRAVCDFCGPTDFTREDYVRDAGRKKPAILEAALIKLLGGPWEEKREAANMASPVYFISKDDPPFLIVHGDADRVIPVKHSQMLYDKLKEAGVEVTLHIVKDGGHGVAGYPDVLDKAAEFFDKHLKKKAQGAQ